MTIREQWAERLKKLMLVTGWSRQRIGKEFDLTPEPVRRLLAGRKVYCCAKFLVRLRELEQEHEATFRAYDDGLICYLKTPWQTIKRYDLREPKQRTDKQHRPTDLP